MFTSTENAGMGRDPREDNPLVIRAAGRGHHGCAPDDSIQRVAGIMSEHQVRRLPVVDADGRLLGIVTLADLAKHLNGLSVDHPTRDLLVPTLAAIGERHAAIAESD